MAGLWKRLDHEKTARQEKAKKPDYHESFGDPVNQPEPKTALASMGLRFTKHGVVTTPQYYKNRIRKFKDRAIRELNRITNRHPVMIDQRKYAFKWSVTEFAKANAIERSDAEKIFPKIKEEAQKLRKMVESRLLRAEPKRTSAIDDQSGQKVQTTDLGFSLMTSRAY